MKCIHMFTKGHKNVHSCTFIITKLETTLCLSTIEWPSKFGIFIARKYLCQWQYPVFLHLCKYQNQDIRYEDSYLWQGRSNNWGGGPQGPLEFLLYFLVWEVVTRVKKSHNDVYFLYTHCSSLKRGQCSNQNQSLESRRRGYWNQKWSSVESCVLRGSQDSSIKRQLKTL